MTGNAVRVLLIAALLGLAAGCVEPTDDSAGLDVYRARLERLETRDFFATTRIVDRHGRLLAERAPQGYRTWIPLEAMPVALRQAVIATEDASFYENTGVDTSAVARAALQNYKAGEIVSGASTITMQLVRQVAFDEDERYEPTFERKLREAHLAAEVSERFSKDEILEAYLNISYFGHRAYGVEAAAQAYFGRHAKALTASQATLLAGLLQAPARLDPLENLEPARARQEIVLERMVDAGYLTAAAAEGVLAEPLQLAAQQRTTVRRAPHFVDYVVDELTRVLPPEVAARGGFTVTTTLDLALQERVADIAAAHVAELDPAHDVTDAAVVVVQPSSGEVLAMTGGLDYDRPGDGQVNVATRPRQPGSAFKPITYAAALEAGRAPTTVLWDIPLTFDGAAGARYQPENYDDRYRGPVRLRDALAGSLNAAAIDLVSWIGLERVHRLALDLGLPLEEAPWHYGLSLTLGSAELPLLDLTAAYAAFADGGRYTPPTGIRRVDAPDREAPLYVHAPAPQRVVSAETAWLISDILSDDDARRPAFGANNALEVSQPAAVKTGTSNGFRDNLTVGYTPYLAVGVWAGNKDGRPMRDVLGVTGAAPIWHDTMEHVFASPALLDILGGGQPPPQLFVPPSGITTREICHINTLAVDGSCQRYREHIAGEALPDDAGGAYAWFALRRPPGPGGPCAVPLAEPAPGRRLALLVDRPPAVADQVRRWAQANGVQVAPPTCDGEQRTAAAPLNGAARP